MFGSFVDWCWGVMNVRVELNSRSERSLYTVYENGKTRREGKRNALSVAGLNIHFQHYRTN